MPKRRKNSKKGSSGDMPGAPTRTRLPLVEMLTTAGPCCCTSEAKFGKETAGAGTLALPAAGACASVASGAPEALEVSG